MLKVIFCMTDLVVVYQEERLLRELLPSPSPTDEHAQQPHHTHSDEQWLVSSELQKPEIRDSAEVSKLHERAKLQAVLQDQLSQQLQQERTTTEKLRHRFEEQQQINANMQHQLEQTHLDAQRQQCQLKMVQLEVEEAHQRAQLQDLLTEQVHSQLQEVTNQREWYRLQNQQLDEQLTPAAVRECKGLEVRSATTIETLHLVASALPLLGFVCDCCTGLWRAVISSNVICAVLCCLVLCSAVLSCAVLSCAVLKDAHCAQTANPDLQQPEPVNTSLDTTPGSPDISAHVAAPDTMEVCCNALYGSDQATASLDSLVHHGGDLETAARQQHLDDIKENLIPPSGAPAGCLWPHFRDAAQDVATATGASLKHGLACAEQYALSPYHTRSTGHSPGPLQSLTVGQTCQSTLLPVPTCSAAAQALSDLLTHPPSQLLTHSVNESGHQPAADVCLFGLPPRQPHDKHRSFWGVSAVSMRQHRDNSRGGLGYMGDSQTLPDPHPLMPDPHAGHPHAATQQPEEAVRGVLSQDVSSEKAFRQLLESAQQQRVSIALISSYQNLKLSVFPAEVHFQQ